MAVTLINTFNVPEDQEQNFLREWKRTTDHFSRSSGFVETKLHRNTGVGDGTFKFVNIATWASAEAWRSTHTDYTPTEDTLPGVKGHPAIYESLIEVQHQGTSPPLRGPRSRPFRSLVMPTMHLNETRRVRRFGDQRWILNALIGVIGVEWDQGRLGYMAGACGHDSQGDFIGLRALIKTYDDISREFMKAGRRREMRALAELKQGHAATAREGFFTASIMYGGAQWAIEANTPLNLALNQKKNECYGEFIKLAGRRIEQVEIPFAGRSVPATLHVPPDAGARKLPCVVIVSGMDGWRDISVAMDGDKWLTRGFAVLAIDGPGQGEALCREVWFDPDTYGQLGPAAYDFAASVPEIDPHRIVVNGLSFGSYWATLMAAAEPRFAACGVAMTCFEPHGFTIFETASPTFKLRFMYMTGIDDEAALETLLARIDVSVLAPAIRCPFLVAAGEDEQLSDPRHTFAFLNSLEGPKTLILYEGEDHGMHASRAGRLGPEAYTMVADWLLDRVNGRPAQSLYIEVDATGSVHSAEWGAERQYTYGLTENLKQLVFGAGPLPSNVPSPLPTSERALKAAE